MSKILCVSVCALALGVGVATAGTVEEVVFETGSIGPFGAPVASGWQAEQLNTLAAIGPATAGRTFNNGTNNEVLTIFPYFNSPADAFMQGATWDLSDDADASQTPEVVEPGEVVYLITEIFSDLALGNQELKTGLAVGEGGNGLGFLGFDDGTTGGDGFDQSLQTQTTWGNNFGDAGSLRARVMGTDRGSKFSQTNYGQPPTREDLDNSRTLIGLFRQGADSPASRSFVGTETEVSDNLGTFNGVFSQNLNVGNDPGMIWGGNEREMEGLIINHAQVHVMRGREAFDEDAVLSNHVDAAIPDEIQIGIKYVRFGTTSLTDFNLDDRTTASGDGSVLLANLGTGGANPQGEKTFFDGDSDNDQDVTASADGAALVSALAADHTTGPPETSGNPAEPGTAYAVYDPASGEITVHANGVARVSLFSAGGNILHPLTIGPGGDIGNFLVATGDNPNSGDVTWIALANIIGTIPGSTSVTGNIIAQGTPCSDLELRYQLVGGAKEGIEGEIECVPEPGSLALLALVGLGLVAYRRRSA